MVVVDMPLPGRCLTCPLSYYIQFGEFEGRLMCNAMEAKQGAGFDKIAGYIVSDSSRKRPDNCPIRELVQCKDCKYLKHLPWLDDESGPALICRKHNFVGCRKENWFCADCERKEEDACTQ